MNIVNPCSWLNHSNIFHIFLSRFIFSWFKSLYDWSKSSLQPWLIFVNSYIICLTTFFRFTVCLFLCYFPLLFSYFLQSYAFSSPSCLNPLLIPLCPFIVLFPEATFLLLSYFTVNTGEKFLAVIVESTLLVLLPQAIPAFLYLLFFFVFFSQYLPFPSLNFLSLTIFCLYSFSRIHPPLFSYVPRLSLLADY